VSGPSSSPPEQPLVGDRVTLRRGNAAEVDALQAILAEPSVARWWGEPETRETILETFDGSDDSVLLVIEVDGEIAGGIQSWEETDPDYRHAGIDVYVGERFQDRGLGTEAVRLLAPCLFDVRGHHRLTIDPALANERAIRAYEKVGFQRVGVMRRYERSADGTFHDGLLLDLLRDELED
jgi:aminoglycoside 6'-N-acetyltransferase